MLYKIIEKIQLKVFVIRYSLINSKILKFLITKID
jgi:hypothetical protein